MSKAYSPPAAALALIMDFVVAVAFMVAVARACRRP
jgi:hypothetical protein